MRQRDTPCADCRPFRVRAIERPFFALENLVSLQLVVYLLKAPSLNRVTYGRLKYALFNSGDLRNDVDHNSNTRGATRRAETHGLVSERRRG